MNHLQQFLNYLTHEKRYSPHTVAAYESDLKQFDAYLHRDEEDWSPERLAKAEYPDMRAWIIGLIDQGISPVSINRKIASIAAYFKFLQNSGWVSENHALRLMRLKAPKKLPQFVPADDLCRILDETIFPQGFEGSRDRLVLELLYGAGLRRGELLSLQLGSIDLSRELLKVRGKGGKSRLIPLTRHLQAVIREYLGEFHSGSGPLIQTASGKAAYPMLIQRIVKKYLGAAKGLERKSPHALRHSFATHLLDQGADLGAIRELLGHESLAATQVYTHNALSRLKAVFDKSHPRSGQ